MEPDKGTTKFRSITSEKTGQTNAYWHPWPGAANGCLVPLTSPAEPDQDNSDSRKNVWFALSEDRPAAFFAAKAMPVYHTD